MNDLKWRSPIFEKKIIWPKNGPFGQNEVLGHFLIQNALDYADFAYYDREQQYLVPSAEKNFAGPKMGRLGPKRGQNEVSGHFPAQNVLVFGDFAYYYWK